MLDKECRTPVVAIVNTDVRTPSAGCVQGLGEWRTSRFNAGTRYNVRQGVVENMQRLLLGGCEVSESKVVGDHVDLTTMAVPRASLENRRNKHHRSYTAYFVHCSTFRAPKDHRGLEGSESQQANATTANNASVIRPLFKKSTSFLPKLHRPAL